MLTRGGEILKNNCFGEKGCVVKVGGDYIEWQIEHVLLWFEYLEKCGVNQCSYR